MTLGISRAPDRSRSAMASARTLAGSRRASSAARRSPQPPGLVAGFGAVAGRQGGREQVPIVLLAGRGGLGGPDRVQQGQVIGVGERLVAGLGGRELLAVMVQHRGEHAERRARQGRRGGRGGIVRSFGMNLVVPGQLGSPPRAGCGVGAFRGDGEHVGEVGVGAAGQGDVGVLAVLGAGDHRQAGVHGAALGGVVGDRIAEFGDTVAGVPGKARAVHRRCPVRGSASTARRTISPPAGDGLDAEQVAVGERAAGAFPRLDGAVVAGADDQVTAAGLGAIRDGDRGGAGRDDAQGDEVVADAAVEFAAQRVVGGHQQGVGAAHEKRDVGLRGGVHHLLRVSPNDPAVLVILGQHRGVAITQPQAGGLFPGVAEPDGFGQPGVAEGIGEQGHAAAVFHGLQLAGVPGQDHLPAAGFGVADQVGQVRAGHHRGLIDQQQRRRAGL